MYVSEAGSGCGQVRLERIQWEDKWDIIMSELGKGVKILACGERQSCCTNARWM